MRVEQIIPFLHALGVHNAYDKGNGWIIASCPLARWKHQSGKDASPSFGITAKEGERSNYNCFSCGTGSAEEIIQAMEMYVKGTQHFYQFALARELLENELAVLPLPDYEEFKPVDEVFQEWPSYWLDSFPSASLHNEAYMYLKGRGVSLEDIDKYEIKWDGKKRMVVSTYRDVFGRLAGARGRAIDCNVEGYKKHYDYSWSGVNNAGMVWFNEPCLELDGPVVTVEGQYDCYNTLKAWPKTVANLTAMPRWVKIKKLSYSEHVIHIPDPDKTGMDSIPKWSAMCEKAGVRYSTILLPQGEEKIDPAVCHPDWIRDQIEAIIS